MATVTRKVDTKGRLVLGDRFAGRDVIIDTIDETEVRVTLARVIPEREAWLLENKAALAMVQHGIAAAKAGEFADGPDLDADLADFPDEA